MESDAVVKPPKIERLLNELARKQNSINNRRIELLEQLQLVSIFQSTSFFSIKVSYFHSNKRGKILCLDLSFP